MEEDTEPIWKQEEDVVDYQPSGQPQPTIHASPSDVPNYLTLSILNAVFCCICLGIPAIVYSVQANSLRLQDPDRALARAITARYLNIAGLIIGVILIIVAVVLNVV